MTTSTSEGAPSPSAPPEGGPAAEHDVVIVGGGQAGLAVGALLRKSGIEPVILERDAIGSKWRGRYDRLHLHTHRAMSALPGLRIPRSEGTWVPRERFVAYLDRYVAHHGLSPRTGVEVQRLERAGDRWRVHTADEVLEARVVVMATGFNRTPRIPDWPGRETFTGELLHASEYRNFEPFVGKDVLVVGSGNTGTEFAQDLAENGARTVWNAIRTVPHIVPRAIGPLPIQATTISGWRLPAPITNRIMKVIQRATIGDLAPYGLPAPKEGAFSQKARNRDYVPIIDVGYVAQVKAGRIEVVGAVERFDGPRVHLAGGRVLEPDVVIAATGYQRDLDGLLGHLGVLAPDGGPKVVDGAGAQPGAPGLYCIGYRNNLNGAMWEQSFQARRVARAVTRRLRAARAAA